MTDSPPEPTEREELDASTIELGIPKKEETEEDKDPTRKGKVAFFDHSKAFGFIMDSDTDEKHFVHISGLIDKIDENDKVTFILEKDPKGMIAVQVTLQE